MGRPQALRPIFDAYPRGVVAMATIRKKPILGRIAAKFVNFQFFEDDVTVQQDVPEPSTWAMMLIGSAGLGFACCRSRRRAVAAVGTRAKLL